METDFRLEVSHACFDVIDPEANCGDRIGEKSDQVWLAHVKQSMCNDTSKE